MHVRLSPAVVTLLVAVQAPCAVASDNPTAEEGDISEITVRARRVANLRPAGTYAAPVLDRYDDLAHFFALDPPLPQVE